MHEPVCRPNIIIGVFWVTLPHLVNNNEHTIVIPVVASYVFHFFVSLNFGRLKKDIFIGKYKKQKSKQLFSTV